MSKAVYILVYERLREDVSTENVKNGLIFCGIVKGDVLSPPLTARVLHMESSNKPKVALHLNVFYGGTSSY